MPDKLNPNEVSEVSEELANISKRYNLDGHLLVTIRGGQTSFVGNVSLASLMSSVGPSLIRMMADKMSSR